MAPDEVVSSPLSFDLGILAGPLVFFALFMAIEPVTTPTTLQGRLSFGLALGVLVFAASFSPWMLGNSFFLYIPLLFLNLMLRVLPERWFA